MVIEEELKYKKISSEELKQAAQLLSNLKQSIYGQDKKEDQ